MDLAERSMERHIAVFQKNSREQIRVVVKEYRGHEIVDIRVYWTKDRAEWFPSRKGLAITTDKLPMLLGALHKAAEMVGEDLEPAMGEDPDALLTTLERAELAKLCGVEADRVEEFILE
jgi:hypothetical protein